MNYLGSQHICGLCNLQYGQLIQLLLIPLCYPDMTLSMSPAAVCQCFTLVSLCTSIADPNWIQVRNSSDPSGKRLIYGVAFTLHAGQNLTDTGRNVCRKTTLQVAANIWHLFNNIYCIVLYVVIYIYILNSVSFFCVRGSELMIILLMRDFSIHLCWCTCIFARAIMCP